jgi:hypothetical protein
VIAGQTFSANDAARITARSDLAGHGQSRVPPGGVAFP